VGAYIVTRWSNSCSSKFLHARQSLVAASGRPHEPFRIATRSKWDDEMTTVETEVGVNGEGV
jgi:hypothetical protein